MSCVRPWLKIQMWVRFCPLICMHRFPKLTRLYNYCSTFKLAMKWSTLWDLVHTVTLNRILQCNSTKLHWTCWSLQHAVTDLEWITKINVCIWIVCISEHNYNRMHTCISINIILYTLNCHGDTIDCMLSWYFKSITSSSANGRRWWWWWGRWPALINKNPFPDDNLQGSIAKGYGHEALSVSLSIDKIA